MNRLIIVPLAFLAASCTVQVGDDGSSATTTSESTRTTSTTVPRTTAVPTTTSTTTTTTPFDADFAAYEDDLAYLNTYCYSDCGRVDEATWLGYVDRADGLVLADAIGALATMSFSELDTLCGEFWARPDQEIIDLYFGQWSGPGESDAVLAALWFTCDS